MSTDPLEPLRAQLEQLVALGDQPDVASSRVTELLDGARAIVAGLLEQQRANGVVFDAGLAELVARLERFAAEWRDQESEAERRANAVAAEWRRAIAEATALLEGQRSNALSVRNQCQGVARVGLDRFIDRVDHELGLLRKKLAELNSREAAK